MNRKLKISQCAAGPAGMWSSSVLKVRPPAKVLKSEPGPNGVHRRLQHRMTFRAGHINEPESL